MIQTAIPSNHAVCVAAIECGADTTMRTSKTKIARSSFVDQPLPS
jgi:hypothetical protein